MNASTTTEIAAQRDRTENRWGRARLSALWATMACLVLPGIAHATGGSDAAQARITAVALGWQNIVIGVGVAILVIAWSVIGYAVAFNGKTMKDMQNPAIGTTVAGLAPVLVGWMFS